MSISTIPARDRPNIYIGMAASIEDSEIDEKTVCFDGYIAKTVGKDLILTGAKPYSCLYAVYHLLERYLGCGFFEDGDQIPRAMSLEIGTVNDVEKPRFGLRSYANNIQYAYSGIRWWDWEQFKNWVNWMAKKCYNHWELVRDFDSCGIIPLAATKMGIPMELTNYQKKRFALQRCVLEYARMLGIRISYNVSLYQKWKQG